MPDLSTPCWRWPGTHRKSDGRPTVGGQYVYRMVYEARYGFCPPLLHHVCEHQWCINPDHLEAMEGQGEHAREHEIGGDKSQAAKTHCPRGHPYDDENTVWVVRKSRGGKRERHCRTCMRDWKRKRRVG